MKSIVFTVCNTGKYTLIAFPSFQLLTFTISLYCRFMPNVSQTPRYSYNPAIATITTASTPRPSVKSPQVARWKSLTMRNLRNCYLSASTTALRPCMSSQKCAPYAWVLSKVGGRNTTDRTSLAHPVGSKYIYMGPCSGLTRYWPRWDHRTTP